MIAQDHGALPARGLFFNLCQDHGQTRGPFFILPGGTTMLHPLLFESQNLFLEAVDLEKDPAVMSGWTYDLDIARAFGAQLPHPMAPCEVKRYLGKRQKESVDNGAVFLFAIHTRQDDQVTGLLDIGHVMWNHGNTGFRLIFGDPELRLKFGQEGMLLALQYIFDELNLFRATLLLPEYDQVGISMAEAAGFNLEVRMRQADFHSGQCWNRLAFGLLRTEYEAQRLAEVAA